MYPLSKKIPIDKCVERKVYRLCARNIKIGVYLIDNSCPVYSNLFFGIRTKFGKRYIDCENHYDGGEFRSCVPVEEICDLPDDIEIQDFVGKGDPLFDWLEAKEKELGYDDGAYEEWKKAVMDEDRENNKNA